MTFLPVIVQLIASESQFENNDNWPKVAQETVLISLTLKESDTTETLSLSTLLWVP